MYLTLHMFVLFVFELNITLADESMQGYNDVDGEKA